MIKITIEKWNSLIYEMYENIKDKTYTGVYGVPRGGIPIAVVLAEKMNIPLLSSPITNCLVVDDLIDSGTTEKKYKNYHFKVLIDKRNDTVYHGKWIEFWYEDTNQDAEDLIVRQFEYIGEDATRLGLLETPKRVVKMWKEIYRGYDKTQKPKITSFDNGADGLTYDEMVIDTGTFYSQCEHHMVPFFGDYWFAYVPDKKIVGISKIGRLIDFHSAKLQIQERLVKEVLDDIEREIKPKGLALVMKGEHLCKTMRGVKKKGKMITTDLRGIFKSKSEARAEFMNFVNGGR